MIGTVYNFVKRYDDRFICVSIVYSHMLYYFSSKNRFLLHVLPIEQLEESASAFSWDLSQEDACLSEFFSKFKIKSRLPLFENLLMESLDELEIGDNYSRLKSLYEEKYNELKRKEQSETRERQRQEYQLWAEQNRKAMEREQERRAALYKELDHFCAYISPPEIEKTVESPEGVFDIIRVTVGLSQQTPDDELDELLRKYRRGISEKVIKAVQEDRHYKLFNVPINFIKIDKVMLNRRAKVLHYVLSLRTV